MTEGEAADDVWGDAAEVANADDACSNDAEEWDKWPCGFFERRADREAWMYERSRAWHKV
jgi:hypothetical protein